MDATDDARIHGASDGDGRSDGRTSRPIRIPADHESGAGHRDAGPIDSSMLLVGHRHLVCRLFQAGQGDWEACHPDRADWVSLMVGRSLAGGCCQVDHPAKTGVSKA